jgi:hypothetical protein
VVIILSLSHRALGQVINSLSPNKMGIYTHALDTVITSLMKEKPLRTVYVKGEACAAIHLPSIHQDVTIKTDEKSLRRKRKLKTAEIFVTINCLTIDRDFITIIMIVFDGQRKPFVASYQYQPKTMDYRLVVLQRQINFQ